MIAVGIAFAWVLLVAVVLADRQVTRLLAPRAAPAAPVSPELEAELADLRKTVKKLQAQVSSFALHEGYKVNG